jgi:ribosome-binding factor A
MIERNRRVGELIAREVSLVLEFKINDNRLKNVTIIGAEASKNLKFCRIFFSVTCLHKNGIKTFDTEREVKKALNGFNSSKSFIKREVFSRVLLRSTPELAFQYDAGIEKASRIFKIINDYYDDKI